LISDPGFFEPVDSKRVTGIFFAFCRYFPVSVDYKGVASQRTHKHRPQRHGARENHCQLARAPQYLKNIVHEGSSKINDDIRKGTRRGGRRLQDKENVGFIDTIKKLDNHALNKYTALRAGLGTRELSWSL